MKLDPCSHCRSPNPSVKKKSGRVGVTRASYYRETVKCKSCNVEVTAGTPGNAIKFWNRSYAGLSTEANNSLFYMSTRISGTPTPSNSLFD